MRVENDSVDTAPSGRARRPRPVPGRAWVASLIAASIPGIVLIGVAGPPGLRRPTPAAKFRQTPAIAGSLVRSLGRPVAGPILDGFDFDPGDPYAGHRGVGFATRPGETVHAAAGGVVTFSGPVAGVVYVSVDHRNGLVTRYGRLAAAGVARGREVGRGDPLGVMPAQGSTLHLSVRLDGRFVDPSPWFDGVHVHLVPSPAAG